MQVAPLMPEARTNGKTEAHKARLASLLLVSKSMPTVVPVLEHGKHLLACLLVSRTPIADAASIWENHLVIKCRRVGKKTRTSSPNSIGSYFHK